MNAMALKRAGLTLRVIPPRGAVDGFFAAPENYETAIAEIQRLRGCVYLSEGAIPPEALDAEGRHVSSLDEVSHHLTLWNGELQGCLRLTLYRDSYPMESFKVYELIKRMPAEQAALYRYAFREFIHRSKAAGLCIGETGGWSVSKNYQYTIAALALPISAWSLAQLYDRYVWIASATERNSSAEMLRRFGGYRLSRNGQELPSFFDPVYGCRMELLCFRSNEINSRFATAAQILKEMFLSQAHGQTQFPVSTDLIRDELFLSRPQEDSVVQV